MRKYILTLVALSGMLWVYGCSSINSNVSDISQSSLETNQSEFWFELNENTGTYTITYYDGEGGDLVIPAEYEGKAVTKINDGVFQSFHFDVTSVTLPESLVEFPRLAALPVLERVTIPSSVASLPNGAFAGDSSLKTLDIPETITALGDNCFSSSGLTEISLPDSITSMGKSDFEACRSLTKATLSGGVKKIPERTFYDCYMLEQITIPSGVTSIGKDAFRGCMALSDIYLPDTLASVDAEAAGLYRNKTKIHISSVSPLVDFAKSENEHLDEALWFIDL